MESLDGRVAIVTGAASGIGKAVVETFARANIKAVILSDIQAEKAEAVAANVRDAHGCETMVAAIDVSRQDLVNKMVEDAMAEFGRVDILVNNAGICPVRAWDDTTLEDWNKVLEINLTSAFLCSKAVLLPMREQKYGRIVNISSAGAFLGSVVADVAYGVSKAGMIALTKVIAKRFATEGIYCNAIAPGSIDTPMTDSFGPEIRQNFAKVCPMQRQGSPEELAGAVWFLVSNPSNYVNGSTLHVNGGSLLV